MRSAWLWRVVAAFAVACRVDRRCRAAQATGRDVQPGRRLDRTVIVSRDERGRTRTKIIVQKRSYLDGGTEVMPGDDSAPTEQLIDASAPRSAASQRRIIVRSRPITDPFFLPGKNNPGPPFRALAACSAANQFHTAPANAHQAASFSSSAMIASPISLVPTSLLPADLMSAVRRPLASAAAIAWSIRSASLAHVERVAQRHAERRDHRDRIGDALAGDVGRRAVHRLVERLALLGLRIDVAERGRRQHAERAGQHRRDVRQHVAEQIVGDDRRRTAWDCAPAACRRHPPACARAARP